MFMLFSDGILPSCQPRPSSHHQGKCPAKQLILGLGVWTTASVADLEQNNFKNEFLVQPCILIFLTAGDGDMGFDGYRGSADKGPIPANNGHSPLMKSMMLTAVTCMRKTSSLQQCLSMSSSTLATIPSLFLRYRNRMFVALILYLFSIAANNRNHQ